MSKNEIKLRIRLADDVNEANIILSENENFNTYGEKFAYLTGLFNIEIFDKYDGKGVTDEQSVKIDYYSALSVVINEKWGG